MHIVTNITNERENVGEYSISRHFSIENFGINSTSDFIFENGDFLPTNLPTNTKYHSFCQSKELIQTCETFKTRIEQRHKVTVISRICVENLLLFQHSVTNWVAFTESRNVSSGWQGKCAIFHVACRMRCTNERHW